MPITIVPSRGKSSEETPPRSEHPPNLKKPLVLPPIPLKKLASKRPPKMAGPGGEGGGWGGYDDDDDWGLSAEQLDQIERDAIRQLAERKASSAAASTSPAPAPSSALGAISPLPSRATAPAAAATSPLGANHPAARASLEARFGKVRVPPPCCCFSWCFLLAHSGLARWTEDG